MTDPERCSFCDKPRADVLRLIAGRGAAAICDGCVRVCAGLLDETDAARGVTRCSFCGAPRGQVEALFESADRSAFACAACARAWVARLESGDATP